MKDPSDPMRLATFATVNMDIRERTNRRVGQPRLQWIVLTFNTLWDEVRHTYPDFRGMDFRPGFAAHLQAVCATASLIVQKKWTFLTI
eukprot:12229032-Prorocentrum_lima.AAC.1